MQTVLIGDNLHEMPKPIVSAEIFTTVHNQYVQIAILSMSNVSYYFTRQRR